MRVEWKEGRRALVLVHYENGASVLEDCFGYLTQDHVKCWLRTGKPWGPALSAEEHEAYPLPFACPRCFEVDDHADGCMVDENLARGVPAFWAPWAMWQWPQHTAAAGLFEIGPAGVLYVYPVNDITAAVYPSRGTALVAIGPDGPTLEPWGQS